MKANKLLGGFKKMEKIWILVGYSDTDYLQSRGIKSDEVDALVETDNGLSDKPKSVDLDKLVAFIEKRKYIFRDAKMISIYAENHFIGKSHEVAYIFYNMLDIPVQVKTCDCWKSVKEEEYFQEPIKLKWVEDTAIFGIMGRFKTIKKEIDKRNYILDSVEGKGSMGIEDHVITI